MKKRDNEIGVLIVDDDRNTLHLLFRTLEQQDYKIFVAENGSDAIRLAGTVQPDLILLDVRLPDINGFEVCRALKAADETKRIPVIFMTGMTETVDKLKGFDVGGVDYITKPFDYDELIVRIQTQLKLQSLQKEIIQERNRFQRLVEVSSEGILIHNGKRITEANSAAEAISGYTLSELTNRKISDLFKPEYHDLISENIESGSEQVCEVHGKRKDGKFSVLKIQGKKIQYLGNDLNILLMHDISHEKKLEQENLSLRLSLSTSEHFGEMVGKSTAMKKVYEQITLASGSDETVVITGETGTGKELAARMIFTLSSHYTRSFIIVNCAAILDSLFESQFFGYCKGAFTGANFDMTGFFGQANGGTLFLDEIGELKPEMQAKLLRVIQNGEYMPVGSSETRTADVRIIAATNRNIQAMVDKGEMRADFFHRLNVINITIPPLRRRREDIPLLTRHFLSLKTEQGSSPHFLPEKELRRLCSYDWPGNVRELFNVLRRYRVNGTLSTEGSLPAVVETEGLPFLKKELPLGKAVEAFEIYYIKRVLDRCSGKKQQAAEVLGVNRRTLYNKLIRSDK